jgi:hypothetical protein
LRIEQVGWVYKVFIEKAEVADEAGLTFLFIDPRCLNAESSEWISHWSGVWLPECQPGDQKNAQHDQRNGRAKPPENL